MDRLAVICVTCSIAVATCAAAADLPVVANKLVTGPMSRVELTNTSNQPVTAWTLVVTTKEKDGTTRRAVETIDAYLSEVTRDFPGMSDKVDRLMPGQSRIVELDPVAAGSTADVTAVIFQDGTSAGDRETIDSIFEGRVKERDQLKEIVSTFDAVLPSAKGLTMLEELKKRFAAVPPAGESTPHRAAREAIDAYLKRANPSNADAIDGLVRKYADVVKREYDLAERHSRPATR